MTSAGLRMLSAYGAYAFDQVSTHTHTAYTYTYHHLSQRIMPLTCHFVNAFCMALTAQQSFCFRLIR